MRRRKLLLGLGGLAGAGGIVGSGAFTSITANRDVTVAVAGDSKALLKLEPSTSPNGEYASISDGTLGIDFGNNAQGADGPGTDSVYDFDDVFTVTNQGTQPAYVWGTFDGASGNFTASGSETDIWLYPGDDRTRKLRDSDDAVIELGVGETVDVGVHLNTHSVTSDQMLTLTLHANAQNPNKSMENEPETKTLVVDENGTGDVFNELVPALDAASSGDTVRIKKGTYSAVSPGPFSYQIKDHNDLVIEGVAGSPTDVEIQGLFEIAIDSADSGVFTLRNVTVKPPNGLLVNPAFRIANSSSGGPTPTGFRFENVKIENNDVGPAELVFPDGVENLVIENSEFSFAGALTEGYDGLHIDEVAKNIMIRESEFSINSGSGIQFDNLNQTENIEIKDSNFVSNEQYGIEFSGTSSSEVTVTGCYFKYNDAGKTSSGISNTDESDSEITTAGPG